MAACEKDYIQQLKDNDIVKEEEEKKETKTVSGKILRMTDAVVDGNSHFYLVLEGSDAIYDAPITNVMDVVRYQIGDEITLEYEEGEKSNSVVKIGGE